jgi:hypothetical protein
MKQIFILTILFFGTLHPMFASDYEQVMAENIQKMYTAQSMEQLTDVANQFERIAAKENDQWLPAYYQAYSYISMLFMEQGMPNDEKSPILDKAQAVLDGLKKSSAKESEVFVLQGMLYQMRISDEGSAYQFSMMADEALTIAEKLNPDNPRAHYLKGCNIFYTPEQFGGGPAKAKPLLEKAQKLFANNKTENSLLPNWGKEHCALMLEQCAAK